jgi:hypothetical protein
VEWLAEHGLVNGEAASRYFADPRIQNQRGFSPIRRQRASAHAKGWMRKRLSRPAGTGQ